MRIQTAYSNEGSRTVHSLHKVNSLGMCRKQRTLKSYLADITDKEAFIIERERTLLEKLL